MYHANFWLTESQRLQWPGKRQHELIEKARNALFLGGPGDRFSNQRRDRNNSNIVGNPNRFGCLNCIGENEFLKPRGGNSCHRPA